MREILRCVIAFSALSAVLLPTAATASVPYELNDNDRATGQAKVLPHAVAVQPVFSPTTASSGSWLNTERASFTARHKIDPELAKRLVANPLMADQHDASRDFLGVTIKDREFALAVGNVERIEPETPEFDLPKLWYTAEGTPTFTPTFTSKSVVQASNSGGVTSDAMTRDSRSGAATVYTSAAPAKADGQSTELGNRIVQYALQGEGVPYVWGGNTAAGWDCSGFARWAYAKAGVNIARGTAALLASGQFVRTSHPKPGDLVFQNGGHHVVIYLGNGRAIGAQNPSVDTILQDVNRSPLYGYYTLRN